MTRLAHAGVDPDTGRNRWSLRLLDLEATIVSSLPDQIEALLGDPDSNRRVIDRLFPVSYADPGEQRAHRKLLGRSLLDERRELVDAVRRELDAGRRSDRGLELTLTPPKMDLLLRFINDVRLVLATDLGIETNLGEHKLSLDDPDTPKYALLEYLSGLEAILVEALGREF